MKQIIYVLMNQYINGFIDSQLKPILTDLSKPFLSNSIFLT